MRLLHTERLQVEDFPFKIPNYAILSHRWLDEEVTFEDIKTNTATSKKGYQKLRSCCKLARESGYEWVWIDTCCIDKRSSAELSEAINSMYAWYRRSSICYAYLGEDADPTRPESWKTSLWFSRGWTLQELLAPRRIALLDGQWKQLGTRESLAEDISRITSITTDVLRGHRSPLECNIAQRMAWASERKTTRDEDMAYCLLGLFDIHMTPIYGEGAEKAFLRLQREILLHNTDQTIFLWTPSHEPYNLGLLATSPKAFCTHPDCFKSKIGILGAPLKLPDFKDDPYSLFKSTDWSLKRSALASEETQESPDLPFPGSLGPTGLQIPLLAIQHPAKPEIIIVCLDVRILLSTEYTRPIMLFLDRDITIGPQEPSIPNGLGTWRRPCHGGMLTNYVITTHEFPFVRKLLTVSQFTTTGAGADHPVTFEYEYSNSPLQNQHLVVVPCKGSEATTTPQEWSSFRGVAGFVIGSHACDNCNEDSLQITPLMIGFGVRGPFSDPWCCVWTYAPDEGGGWVPYVRMMEMMQVRFGGKMSRPLVCCGKHIDVKAFRVDQDADISADGPYTISIAEY